MNGYDYTPENGEVFVRIYKSGEEELQVDVKDNGIGIPFEDQPRIFDRFFRGEHRSSWRQRALAWGWRCQKS